jgi:hypothetical protein
MMATRQTRLHMLIFADIYYLDYSHRPLKR